MRRGLIFHPLTDEHHNPTTRADLWAAERRSDFEWDAAEPRRVPLTPADERTLVATVVAMQRGAGL